MPNGNGQGPMNAGSRSGRGRGFCSGSGLPETMPGERVQGVATEQQQGTAGCRAPQSCGSGMNAGNGRRSGNGCGSKRKTA